jgi:hypothetical protein
MKNILSGLLFFLLNFHCFTQNIKELEHELSFYKSGEEWGNKKLIAFQLLEIDKLNESAINYLVEVYGRNNQKDSISFLFDRLIKENPKNPVPFLIRAKESNARFAGLSFTQQINFLKEAYRLDSVNVEAMYSLGNLYYELFINEFKKDKKLTNLDYYASNSINYFSILYNQSERYKEILNFPLIQLANYTRDFRKKQLYENNKIQTSYFPISAFVDLPKDWKTNYTVNVINYVSDSEFKVSGVESALFHIDWYATYLKALEEPILSDSLTTSIYRFTWLRSFHNPIVIGIENKHDSITLYWKVCDGEGGYEPSEIVENKSKVLSIKEWNDIEASINSINFWNIQTTKSGIPRTDGAQWILEGKKLGKYHVVDRWSGGAIKKVCLKLLELTDLKINQDDIY